MKNKEGRQEESNFRRFCARMFLQEGRLMIGNRNPILYRENSALLSMEFNHCGFQQCTPGYQYGISMRPFHLIHFVLEGRGCLVMGEKKYEVEKGHAFYIPAGMPGYYTADRKDPWKYAWIGVYADVRNPYLKLIFQEKSVVPVALPQDVLEKALLAIIAVTDRRAADVEIYRKEEFPGEQFLPSAPRRRAWRSTAVCSICFPCWWKARPRTAFPVWKSGIMRRMPRLTWMPAITKISRCRTLPKASISIPII